MKYLVLSLICSFSVPTFAESCERISGADVYQGSNVGFASGIPGGDYGALSQDIQEKVSDIQKELLLNTTLGQYVSKISYNCDPELIRMDFGLNKQDATEVANSCRRSEEFPEEPFQISLHLNICSNISNLTMRPREIKYLNLPDVEMTAWSDQGNRTYLNIAANAIHSRSALAGRLYHEMYILRDSSFIKKTYSALSNLSQWKKTKIDIDTNMDLLADPVLQSSLASLRAFQAEVLEMTQNEGFAKKVGTEFLSQNPLTAPIANEAECLAVLAQVHNKLKPSACSIQRGSSVEIKTYGYQSSHSPSSLRVDRANLIKHADKALELFQSLSAKAATSKDQVSLCLTLAKPIIHLSCGGISSMGPSPRTGGGTPSLRLGSGSTRLSQLSNQGQLRTLERTLGNRPTLMEPALRGDQTSSTEVFSEFLNNLKGTSQ